MSAIARGTDTRRWLAESGAKMSWVHRLQMRKIKCTDGDNSNNGGLL